MLPENLKPYCPECHEEVETPDVLDRRNFIRVLGGGAVSALTLGATGVAGAADAPKATTPASTPSDKTAEELVKELYSSLSAEQKSTLVLPFDHGGKTPTRLGMYNSAIGGKRIGENYTKPQQELIQRTLKAICSGEEGYRQISRGGTWDGSRSFEGCGCTLFGEPADGKPFAWVFSGHHLTVRCDGDSEPGAAFGGPIYYGHSPNGYSDKNIFWYQTRSVLSVFDSLSEKQQKQAMVKGSPGEHAPSVRFRPADQQRPGIPYAELTQDQRELVEKVMRDVLAPYRKQDVDEVMAIIKATGGMEKIHLAFYHDGEVKDNKSWHFWRLEGPGFVWNYRVLPHVHTYVNISSKI